MTNFEQIHKGLESNGFGSAEFLYYTENNKHKFYAKRLHLLTGVPYMQCLEFLDVMKRDQWFKMEFKNMVEMRLKLSRLISVTSRTSK